MFVYIHYIQEETRLEYSITVINVFILRVREEQLTKQHKDDVVCLQSDFSREKKDMLQEFREAQLLLKDKIEAMQLM